MPDQTSLAVMWLQNGLTVARTELDDGMHHVAYRASALIDGTWTWIAASAVVRADVELQPQLTEVDGVIVLELVDAAGTVVVRTVQAVPRPAEPEPWPRTQMVPPHVWTELPGGAGTVLNESDATVMVTVGEAGEIEFGGPMRWLPADAQEEYPDGWGDDA